MKSSIIAILAAILLFLPVKAVCEAPTQQEITEWRWDAAQGKSYAQNNLGVMYAQGQGVRQDYAEAVKWYRLVFRPVN